ncbi:bifunctional 4-hydroxy-2-oxoglutarate aldolase/2-dehydro-3-deoxy-phosphogluconate aldolase [Pseudonocardia sp. NPDC046786]|uniref:bifunctional 4-hydroxy-2-oxoglutarate aldolase/2-dehydro-3-deoxy-phosphogluconate aldolase n=1 Tax=Pseudonocardia sp. NPDC046786 TaxID=3155471 RepID=UPI0033C60754
MADLTHFFDAELGERPLMAILRGLPPDRTVELAERAWDAGFGAVEVPVQSAASLDALRATVDAGRRRGRPVGAGTVLSPEHVTRAAAAGAAFTVSPGTDPAVAVASATAGLAHLPGVATATDVQRAVGLGLRWLKAFPASLLGPGWFGAMHGPFPQARFVATGGMDAGNAAGYLAAGAAAVAVGSALEDLAAVDRLAALA